MAPLLGLQGIPTEQWVKIEEMIKGQLVRQYILWLGGNGWKKLKALRNPPLQTFSFQLEAACLKLQSRLTRKTGLPTFDPNALPVCGMMLKSLTCLDVSSVHKHFPESSAHSCYD